MKCLKNKNGVIKRVMEQSVKGLLGSGWSFCPKSEWKALKKGKTTPTQDEVVEEAVKKVKKNKNSKKKNKAEEVVETPAEVVVPEVPKVVKKAKKKSHY